MRKISLLALLVVAAFSLGFDAFSWGIDAVVYDKRVTCFDADYAMDGTLYVAYQKDQSPEFPICCSVSHDRGRTWEDLGCVDSPGQRLEKLRMFVAEYAGGRHVFLFYIGSNMRPYVVRYSLEDTPSVTRSLIAPIFTYPGEFDVARSYHVELGILWPVTPDPQLTAEYPYQFAMVFGFLDRETRDILLYRSTDFGASWHHVHSVTPEPLDREDTAGFAITWGPPDLFYYVYKRFCGSFCCGDDRRGIPECYAPYWGYAVGNGYPGMWRSAGLVYASDDADGEYWVPGNYYAPILAASFDPNDRALWFALHVSVEATGMTGIRYWRWNQPTEAGTGWHLCMRIYAYDVPHLYVGDVEGYRVLGNPYFNFAEVSGTYHLAELVEECVGWRWEEDSALCNDTATEPQHRCVNNHETYRNIPGKSPKLLYSPGSDPGGAGIVYAGFDFSGMTVRHGLFFDAPWFYDVGAFERPGEIRQPDESTFPMTYVPSEGALSVEFDVVSTPVCLEHLSHEVEVSWHVTGGTPSFRVTIEIEGPDGILATHETSDPIGSQVLDVDLPGGGSVSVVVTVRDASGMIVRAENLMLPPC